jgi:hypothetical protein
MCLSQGVNATQFMRARQLRVSYPIHAQFTERELSTIHVAHAGREVATIHACWFNSIG